MSKTKQTVIIFLVAIIFFVLGVAAGGTTSDGDDTFQAGWDAAEQRLAESGFSPMFVEDGLEIKTVYGIIEEINGDKISLRIQPISPLADPELDVRVINIGSANFYNLIQKDLEQYDKEIEEFSNKMQTMMDNPTEGQEFASPEMFIKEGSNKKDLQINQSVSVNAKEDIEDAKQFNAEEVIIQFIFNPVGLEDLVPGVESEFIVPEPTNVLPL